MNNIKKLTDWELAIEKDELLRRMDCQKDSDLYEEMSDEYDELLAVAAPLIKPAVLMQFAEIDEKTVYSPMKTGDRVVFVLLTVGGGISELSTKYFNECDYVKGLMADRMGDFYVGALEKQAMDYLKEECAGRHVGIGARLESNREFPMSYQQTIFDVMNAKELLGMGISSGFMFDPVKSNGFVLTLTDDESKFKVQHDCRKCPRLNCHLRKIFPYDITIAGDGRVIPCMPDETLWHSLQAAGRYIPGACGGNGKCGKCRVRVVSGEVMPPSPDDRRAFSGEELTAGYRLACTARPTDDITIKLCWENDDDIEILTETGNRESRGKIDDEALSVAVDLGTTTIAMELIGAESGEVYGRYSCVNRQRTFGSDVISRILASTKGKGKELMTSVRSDISGGIAEMVKKANVSPEEVGQVLICGNTTMIHLLMGLSCETLGVYPFKPVEIGMITRDYSDVFGGFLPRASVTMMAGISTFVGGDIVSGLYDLDFMNSGKISVLVDLGTNGEIAIGNRDRIMTSSTAAGPAFEGGNIKCGTASVPGAVCAAEYADGTFRTETIGGAPACGICGTGVVEIMAELIENELADETGYLDEDFEGSIKISGDVVFTQKDIREVQLAKAAVRAGIEILIKRYGASYDDIHKLYIAGGFGHKLNCEKAAKIGMFPSELLPKIEAVGNSSLKGGVKYLTTSGSGADIAELLSHSSEISLSEDPKFNQLYAEYMLF